MAELQFTSQRSEILINVSENHSSAKSSPQAAAAHAQTQIERSPSIQAISSEACIPESAERVEDSYKETLWNTVPAELAKDDEEDDDDDLYTVSPSAKAKLDKAIAEVKRTQEERVR